MRPAEDETLSGLGLFFREAPRVARSAQPWAGRCSAVGAGAPMQRRWRWRTDAAPLALAHRCNAVGAGAPMQRRWRSHTRCNAVGAGAPMQRRWRSHTRCNAVGAGAPMQRRWRWRTGATPLAPAHRCSAVGVWRTDATPFALAHFGQCKFVNHMNHASTQPHRLRAPRTGFSLPRYLSV